MAEPGWYDDPANPDHVVWWDGQAWQPQHSQPRPTRPKKKTKGAGTDWILVGAIVLLIAIGAIVIAVIGGSGTGSGAGAGARKKPATTTKAAAATTTIAPVSSTSPPTTTTVRPVTCHPVTSKGSCYEAGEFCRTADLGVTGLSGEGETIKCEQDKGLRWVRT